MILDSAYADDIQAGFKAVSVRHPALLEMVKQRGKGRTRPRVASRQHRHSQSGTNNVHGITTENGSSNTVMEANTGCECVL